jgi:hypothetical protein
MLGLRVMGKKGDAYFLSKKKSFLDVIFSNFCSFLSELSISEK